MKQRDGKVMVVGFTETVTTAKRGESIEHTRIPNQKSKEINETDKENVKCFSSK